MRHFFYSIISLATALFFFMLGIVGVLLPWSPAIRSAVVTFILEHSIAIFLFGFSLTFVSIAIFINIIYSSKRHYYKISSEGLNTWIDQTIIQEYIDRYWQELFPNAQIPNSLSLKNNKIHVVADLPYIPVSEQKVVLERIKNDLSKMFAQVLGYQETFYLAASFQPIPSAKTTKN